MGTKTRIALLIVALALIGAGARWYFKMESGTVPRYRLGKVTQGEIVRIVSSTGTVNPLNTVNVGSQISGNIQEILVDFNSPVKKGQLIAKIDDSVYAAQVEQARAKLLMAEAQLREREKDVVAAQADIRSAEASLFSAKAALKLATAQYQRQKGLLESKVATEAEVETAATAADTATASVNIAAARLESATAQHMRAISQVKGAAANIVDKEAALALASIQLKYCNIVSPINGIVIHRNVDVGQTVAATLQSPTLFTIAEDLSNMQLEVDVSESDVGLIRQGQQVTFTVDAFPENRFRAVVQQIRNMATSVQNVVTYKIIASVSNDRLLLRPGMTANVSIEVARVNDVLKVPNAALRFKPVDESAQEQRKEGTQDSNRMLNRLTEQLELSGEQKEKLAAIIATEAKQLKAVAAATDDDERKRKAYRDFMKQVMTQLYPLLTPEQSAKLTGLLAEWRKASTGEKKQGTVYVPAEDGTPRQIKVLTGIANETETQVLSRNLKDGDAIIIGVDFSAGPQSSGGSANPFLPSRGRR